MLRTIVDVLKEVFWIKPSRRKPSASRRKTVKKPPKKTAKKKPAARPDQRRKPKAAAPLKGRGQAPAAKAPKAEALDPSLVEAGSITHYFDRIKVCVVKLTHGSILIGDKLTIRGPKTKFVQKVWSMQIESEDVKVAKKGQLIGLKVDKIVAVGDKVYK